MCEEGIERAQVSRAWAEDWECPEDAVYDARSSEEQVVTPAEITIPAHLSDT